MLRLMIMKCDLARLFPVFRLFITCYENFTMLLCIHTSHTPSSRKLLLAVQSVVAPPTTSVIPVTPVGDIKVTFLVIHP